MNWLAHQTRPEAAGTVSVLSQQGFSVRSELSEHIKSTASQPLVLHKFENDKMIFITAADAGGVGSKPVVEDQTEVTDTIQAAWVVFLAEHVPSANTKVRASTLSWRSSKLKRRVSSTLASEALAFNQALSEVERLQVMLKELTGLVRYTSESPMVPWRRSCEPLA